MPEEAEHQSAKFERLDYRKLWGLTENDYPIMVTTGYAVYLDKAEELEWETTQELDQELQKSVGVEVMNGILNQAAVLRTYPVEYLTPKQRKNFYTMVGEGLARVFDFDPKSAKQMFNKASEYAVARNQEVARLWYICAGGTSALLFCIMLLAGWFLRVQESVWLGEQMFAISLGSCVGAVGALFSILTRISRIPLDPSAGPVLHWLEGVGRILVGVFGAGFALVAMKVGLLLTILRGEGFSGIFLIAFVAGFSERFVRTLIKRVEMNASAKKEGMENSD